MILSGQEAFKKTENGYNMSKGEGSRSNKRRVKFAHEFADNPSVLVCLNQLDVLWYAVCNNNLHCSVTLITV